MRPHLATPGGHRARCASSHDAVPDEILGTGAHDFILLNKPFTSSQLPRVCGEALDVDANALPHRTWLLRSRGVLDGPNAGSLSLLIRRLALRSEEPLFERRQ